MDVYSFCLILEWIFRVVFRNIQTRINCNQGYNRCCATVQITHTRMEYFSGAIYIFLSRANDQENENSGDVHRNLRNIIVNRNKFFFDSISETQ